jgi:TP901 family phage tail tape measure protein
MANVTNKTVSIFIDQQAAEAALEKLQIKADGFNKKIDDTRKKQALLNQEIQKAEAAGKSTTKLEQQYRSLEKEIASTTVKFNENAAAQKNLQDQIDKGIAPSLRQQESLVRTLRNQFVDLHEGTQQYVDGLKNLRQAETELDRMKTAMNGVEKAQSSWFQQAKAVAFGVVIGNTIQAALASIGSYLSGIVSGNAKLSDSLAKVRQTTGLTDEEVKQLNKDLRSIDTRTAQSELLKIAEIGGQFNVPKEQLKDFVEQIDKVNVVLGSEFGGGAEEITTEMSLLRNVFKDIKSDNISQDIGKISNAVVTLAQEGAATAPVISDFSKRLSPLESTANLSTGAILGLAATLQELAVNPERGGTAVVKLFDKMIGNADAFAKVAGMTGDAFKKLLQQDSFAAFQKVLEGFKNGGSNVSAINSVIKDLEVSGVGAKEVLVKLSQNIGLLQQRSDLATESLTKTDKITEQFGVNNTTLGAQLDKLNKTVNSFIASKTLSEFFTAAVQGINAFIGALKATPQFIQDNLAGISLIATGLVLMNATYIKAGALIIRDTALRIINATTTKASAFATNLATAAQAAYIVVTQFLTGRITLAIAAQRLWNITMSLGVGAFGAIVVAVGVLVVGITSLVGKTKELTTEQKVQNEVQAKILDLTKDEETKAKSLFQTLQQKNLSRDAEKKLLQDLISLSPKYLSGLNEENIKTAEGAKILQGYIDKLHELNRAQAVADVTKDKEKKVAELEVSLVTLRNQSDTKGDFFSDIFGGGSAGKKIIDAENEIKQLKSDLDVLYKETADDITKKVAEDGKNKLDGISKSTAETIGDLKKQIQALDDAFDGIDKTNTAAIKQNRDERKKLQDELDRLTGDANKSAESQANKAKEALQSFQDFMKGLDDAIVNNQIPEHSQKVFAILTKTRDDLQKLQDEKDKLKAVLSHNEFLKLADQFQEAADKIQKKQSTALQQLIEDEAKKAIKPINPSTLLPADTPKQFRDAINALPKAIAELPVQFVLPDLGSLDGGLHASLEKFTRNFKAGLQLDVLTASNGKEKRDALLKQLDEEKDETLSNTTLTENERLVIEQEFAGKRRKIQDDYINGILQDISLALDFAKQGVDILEKFSEAKSNRENAELNKELKGNDAKKLAYKRQLDSKLISQKEYDARITKLDADSDKKKQDLEKKQFERNKKFEAAQAAINGAQAAVKTIAIFGPPIPPNFLGIAAMALTVADTIAEIVAITSAKYEDGGQFTGPVNAKGGKTVGPSHAQKGLPVINPETGKKVAELEGDEGILKKSAMRSNQQYTVTGTPSQITSTLNKVYGGVSWDTTASIQPKYKTRPFQPVAVNQIQKSYTTMKFASGGVFGTATPSTAPQAAQTDPVLLQTLQQSQAINMKLMQTVSSLENQLKQPIQAEVPLKKIDDARDLQGRILNDATFK